MDPQGRLEKFFKQMKEMSDKGEIHPLKLVEIGILKVYRDWEKSNEDIQELYGSSKRD